MKCSVISRHWPTQLWKTVVEESSLTLSSRDW